MSDTRNPPELRPIMLCGLGYRQALNALAAVDCAIRRPHWCSPVVIMVDGKLMLDDDGELSTFQRGPGDYRATDWMMVPRVDDEGRDVPPTYRRGEG